MDDKNNISVDCSRWRLTKKTKEGQVFEIVEWNDMMEKPIVIFRNPTLASPEEYFPNV